jgi:hypothetical protein
MSVIHTYKDAGIYSITARAVYETGIEKTETLIYHVN